VNQGGGREITLVHHGGASPGHSFGASPGTSHAGSRLLLQRNIALLHLSSTVTSSVPTRFSQEIIRAFGLELDI
jgi:hypothetical protein